MGDKELRTFSDCEIRAEQRGDDGDVTVITGYGAVFNSLSEPMWGFREIIAPGAFDDVLSDDVRALFNHDRNFVLGRNGKTLRLSVDERGLKYEIDAPNTQLVRDMVIEPMKRGDISQSSFAFSVDEESWDEDDDGVIIRTIKKIKRLFDVSPVTYPAYTAADSTVRSLDDFKQNSENNHELTELRKAENAKWRAYVERDLDLI